MEHVSTYVVFDLETTGVSSRTDGIVEISAVKVEEGKVVSEFSTLVNPEMPISPSASEVNGITDDMVKDAPVFRDVLPKFLDFIQDSVLIGHNVGGFDMRFIWRFTQAYYGKYIDNDYIDTLPLSRKVLPKESRFRLSALAEHYGYSSEGAHRALNDCHMNQKVYECLCEDMKAKQLTLAAGRSGKQDKLPGCPAEKSRICCECGSVMVLRKGRYGEFYGCSSYPKCRHTENV